MRLPAPILILFLSFALCAVAAQGPVMPLPRLEQEVVSALLREQVDTGHGATRGQVLMGTTTATNLDLWRDCPKLLKDLRARAQHREAAFTEALDDMLNKNETVAQISDLRPAEGGVQ